MHGQRGNVILGITVPCCSGSSHIRGRKGHRALKQFMLSPSLSLQLQRAIARGWEGYFRQVLCPTVGAGCGAGPWGHCPVLAPVHTFVHTNTHTEHSPGPVGQRGGIKHLAPLECLPWKQAKDSMCPQAPGSLILATVYLGEALILIGNMYCCFYVSRARVSLSFSTAFLLCRPSEHHERSPAFLLLSPPSLQAAGSFVRDARCSEGKWLMKRTARGFYPFGLGNDASELVQHLSLLPPPLPQPPWWGREERGRWKELWSPDV